MQDDATTDQDTIRNLCDQLRQAERQEEFIRSLWQQERQRAPKWYHQALVFIAAVLLGMTIQAFLGSL